MNKLFTEAEITAQTKKFFEYVNQQVKGNACQDFSA
jgi:hypothetical protein